MANTGALVWLQRQTASASAQLDFTNFITSEYETYEFVFTNILPAADATFGLRSGSGGGPTYVSGSNYFGGTLRNLTGTVTGAGGNTTSIPLVGVAVDATYTDQVLCGRLTLYHPSGAKYKNVTGLLTFTDNATGGNPTGGWVWGTQVVTTAVTAVRFFMSSGNIASGTIDVYGIAKDAGTGTAASDNPFPSILVVEGTEPTAPAAGRQRLYIDSTTHLLKATNSSGTDRTIEGGSESVSTALTADRAITGDSTYRDITDLSGMVLAAGTWIGWVTVNAASAAACIFVIRIVDGSANVYAEPAFYIPSENSTLHQTFSAHIAPFVLGSPATLKAQGYAGANFTVFKNNNYATASVCSHITFMRLGG